MTALLWLAATALIVLGVIGTVLPALPGVILVFAGIALGAWIDDFTRVPWWMLAIFAALTVLAWIVDYVAAALGAKRAGASWLALVGASVGTVVGLFMGLIGIVFLPLAGAALGEFMARRDLMRAGHVGVATWAGLLIGTALKFAIVFAMVGLFVLTLLF